MNLRVKFAFLFLFIFSVPALPDGGRAPAATEAATQANNAADKLKKEGEKDKQDGIDKKDPELAAKGQKKIDQAEALRANAAQNMGAAKAASDGGGGGGGGDQGGGGQALAGIAAAVAAAAPAVAAAIQASADKEIAKTNANAQIEMTNITSDTSKYMADNQKQIALTQSQIAEQIGQSNNQAQTDRLNMQLAELKAQRMDTKQLEEEKRAEERQYNEQRIGLAQKQADANAVVAKATLNAQLTQAGLSNGFAGTKASEEERLGVSRVLNTGRDISSTGQGPLLASVAKAPTQMAGKLSAKGIVGTNKLLATLEPQGSVLVSPEPGDIAGGSTRTRQPLRLFGRGIVAGYNRYGNNVSPGYELGASPLSQGSSRDVHMILAAE